jgi:hypothetical protein
MKTPMTWLLIVAFVFLLVMGFLCLHTTTDPSAGSTSKDARTPALIGGITSLTLATGLVVLGVFAFRKQE